MPEVDPLAILAATVAAFAAGGAYYAMVGERLTAVSAAAAAEQPPPWKLGAELLRCLVLATVVAGLAAQGGIDEWAGALLLGLALWVAFPAVLWAGAMLHEDTPWRLAAIHAGDWLLKLPLVAVVAVLLQ